MRQPFSRFHLWRYGQAREAHHQSSTQGTVQNLDAQGFRKYDTVRFLYGSFLYTTIRGFFACGSWGGMVL